MQAVDTTVVEEVRSEPDARHRIVTVTAHLNGAEPAASVRVLPARYRCPDAAEREAEAEHGACRLPLRWTLVARETKDGFEVTSVRGPALPDPFEGDGA